MAAKYMKKSKVTFDHHDDNRINDRNVYSDLSEEDEMSDPATYTKPRGRMRKPRPPDPKLAAPQAVTSPITVTPTRTYKPTRRPPPIIIENMEILQLMTKIKPLGIPTPEKLKFENSRRGIKIWTVDDDTCNKTYTFCKEKLDGYTHAPHDQRFIRYFVYGLFPMETETLKTALKTAEMEPEKVRMSPKNEKYPNEATYILYYRQAQGMTLEKLQTFTGIEGITAKFKHCRTKDKEPTQCSNCQAFGHGTEHCFRSPICVRCAENHESRKCHLIPEIMEESDRPKTKPKIPQDKLKCALFGQIGDHSAAYRQCPIRIKYKSDFKDFMEARTSASRKKPPFISQRELPKLPENSGLVHPLATLHRPHYPVQATNCLQFAQPAKVNFNPGNQELLSIEDCMDIYEKMTADLLQCTSVAEQLHTIRKWSIETTRRIQRQP